jgi:hypothetical protein
MGENVTQGNPTLNVLRDPRYVALERVYARIPRIECQRKCQAGCGIIAATGKIEAERLDRQFGLQFGRYFTANGMDARAANGGWLEIGRTYCEFITADGNCDVYSLRPLMCRLFGTVRELACPHGCQPERWLNDAEKLELIRAVEAL